MRHLSVSKDDDDNEQDYLTLNADEEEAGYAEEEIDDDSDYLEENPIDVSQPRALRKEMDVIEEALKIRRREWLKAHMIYIYAGIGIVIVTAIIIAIFVLFQSNNPMGQLTRSAAKNFGTSFDYHIELSEDDKTVMQYTGAISVDRGKRRMDSVYQADYNNYNFVSALSADEKSGKKGTFYKDKWTITDCSEKVQNFFDFDKSFCGGGFNGGAFLRFTGQTSNYSTRELERFVAKVKKQLTTDSTIATITTEKIDGATKYHYDIDLYTLMEMVVDDGASIFYRATSYDSFVTTFNENKNEIKNATFTIDYVIDASGYLNTFDVTMITPAKTFRLSCEMSNFGKAQVEIPDGFYNAVDQAAVKE